MYICKHINCKRRITLLILLVTICVFLSGCRGKKQEESVYRVGIISGAETFTPIADGFKSKMTELGYVVGKNVVYDLQELNADPAGERRVVRKFVEDKVDLIFAFPTNPTLAAKTAVKETDIPVVFALAGIEGNNLIDNVSNPGGNVTGVRFPGPENTVKRLDILHELVPQAKRVLITYDPNYPNAPTALRQLRSTSSSLSLILVEEPVNNVEELRSVLKKKSELCETGIDAILIMPDILSHSPDGWAAIRKFAYKYKVPIAGCMGFTADDGAMFSFIPDNFEMGEMAASIADKIFKGTPAGTIMVVTPRNYLRLNYKVIQELGLSVSENLLSRADEIIR